MSTKKQVLQSASGDSVTFEEIAALFAQLHFLCEEALADCLPKGMSVPQFTLLRCLSAEKRRITEISEILDLSQPSVSDLVRRLYEKGWVTVRIVAADRRQKMVGLSAVGRKKLHQAEAQYRKLGRRVEGYIEPDLLAEADRHLRRLARRLDRIFV